MGQQMGRMPETWNDLIEERDRVLHWSGEILAKVDDNVQNEDTFLMNYSDDKLNAKIKQWLDAGTTLINVVWVKRPSAAADCKKMIKEKVEKLHKEMSEKIRKEYEAAYADIKKFTKRVDKFGEEERKIHEEIQNVERECAGDVGKFVKKFGPLRVKVFKNLEIGEKFMFEDKRLKDSFVKKVYDIDVKIKGEFAKKFEKLVKEAEKCISK
ncbi:hypothetical protein KPH14_004315 [Odynerus spinipes]|uniref:Uncharacterized protein n=1 Tax=Odynerus spinipes TaxID=1348599 RepID=A0AAD9RYL3_9HYME|nr:hypothetical protein KPH14_004315 [Odynerus spinipes]